MKLYATPFVEVTELSKEDILTVSTLENVGEGVAIDIMHIEW